MFSKGSWLSKKEAARALRILALKIGANNVGLSKADYLCNLLSFSQMCGYGLDECLKIINSNWFLDLRKNNIKKGAQ